MAVKSADRTVELLEVLADAGRRLTLAELQSALGYPKSSLHMLLQTLIARGWVEARAGTYGIGVRALLAGTSYLDGDPVVAAAAPVLDGVRTEVNETVHLARLDGGDIVYLASRESQHHLRLVSRIGRRLPAYATALGRAILSARPVEERERLVPVRPKALSGKGCTDRGQILREIEQASARGYATEREQTGPGLGCIAVALTHDDPVTDALSCSIPLARLTDEHSEHITKTLLEAAGRITDLLRRTAL